MSIDTLRADRVGAFGAREALTPNLDRLAARGTVFAQASTAAPLTLPAHASVFSGLWPHHHGVRVNGTDTVGEAVPLLAPAFRDAGFATGAVIGSLVLRSQVGLARGFDLYDEAFAENAGRAPGTWKAERRGEEVVDRALAWLASQGDRRTFLWVHLYDPHAPYEPPSPFRERFAKSPYEGEVAAADAALGRLLDGLEKSGRRASTAVVVLGDHGESLGEHGEETHGVFLYDSTLHVPLVVAAPEGTGRHVDTPVSLVDVAPTLREAAGLPAAAGDGVSLWSAVTKGDAIASRTLYAESVYPAALLGWSPLKAARSATRKYVDAPNRELYDLARDPGETSNRFSADDPIARSLARDLVKLEAGAAPSRTPAGPAADPETVRRLASLGYMTPSGGAKDLDHIDASRVDPKARIAAWGPIEKAVIARQLDRPEEAARLLDRIDPVVLRGDPAVARERALVLRRSRRVPEATEAYHDVLARFPETAEDWFGLGICRHMQKREKDAVAAHRRAVALDPGLTDAWINLGQGSIALHDLAGAQKAFETVLEKDHGNVDALNGLAAVAVERHDLATAEARLREALASDPARSDTRQNLARVVEGRQARSGT